MKYIKSLFLLTLSVCLIGVYANGQSKKHNASFYVVDEVSFVEIQDCVPYSSIDFYSKRGGGKYIESKIANENGLVSCNYRNGAMPAFSSSNYNKNENGIAGTGSVIHFESYDFNLSKIDRFALNLENHITWKCITPASKNISFELWKSNDGLQFYKISSVEGIQNDQLNEYEFKEEKCNAYTVYQLRVFDSKSQKYVSRNLIFDNEIIFTLYPTVSSDCINIKNELSKDLHQYEIYSQSGQCISKGILMSNNHKIDITGLATGNYYVQIANQKDVLKFVKN
jgi:hypothetical protein